MTAYQAYVEYIALKSHFTQKNYDYKKYNGKVKSASVASFERRNDKYLFHKLSKKSDLKGFLISNFLCDSSKWVGDLVVNEEAEAIYKTWLKRTQSLSYTFKSEINNLDDDFNSNFDCQTGHPKLLKLYLSGKVSLETLKILCELTGCVAQWNLRMASDPIWSDVQKKLIKYSSFFSFDYDKMKSIAIDRFA
jgi:hypothetical protein